MGVLVKMFFDGYFILNKNRWKGGTRRYSTYGSRAFRKKRMCWGLGSWRTSNCKTLGSGGLYKSWEKTNYELIQYFSNLTVKGWWGTASCGGVKNWRGSPVFLQQISPQRKCAHSKRGRTQLRRTNGQLITHLHGIRFKENVWKICILGG